MTVKKYVPMHKLCVSLPHPLHRDACVIKFDLEEPTLSSALLKDLQEDEYTTVCISDKIHMEEMELHCEKGFFVLERNAPRSWECGDKLEFINKLVQTEQLAPVAEPQEGWDGTFCSGNYDLIVKNGLIVDCKLVRNIRAGQYRNAAVCADQNGCVTELAVGNPLRVAKACYDDGE